MPERKIADGPLVRQPAIGKPSECAGALGMSSCTWGEKNRFISVQFAGDKVMMFSGKATSFVGPLLYGILITATGNDRAGMTVVIALLLAGLLVLPRR